MHRHAVTAKKEKKFRNRMPVHHQLLYSCGLPGYRCQAVTTSKRKLWNLWQLVTPVIPVIPKNESLTVSSPTACDRQVFTRRKRHSQAVSKPEKERENIRDPVDGSKIYSCGNLQSVEQESKRSKLRVVPQPMVDLFLTPGKEKGVQDSDEEDDSHIFHWYLLLYSGCRLFNDQ